MRTLKIIVPVSLACFVLVALLAVATSNPAVASIPSRTPEGQHTTPVGSQPTAKPTDKPSDEPTYPPGSLATPTVKVHVVATPLPTGTSKPSGTPPSSATLLPSITSTSVKATGTPSPTETKKPKKHKEAEEEAPPPTETDVVVEAALPTSTPKPPITGPGDNGGGPVEAVGTILAGVDEFLNAPTEAWQSWVDDTAVRYRVSSGLITVLVIMIISLAVVLGALGLVLLIKRLLGGVT